MRLTELNELHERGLLQKEQVGILQDVITKKKFSVYYELRLALYIGVLLFTTGIGILIYNNIGELGHLLAIIALAVLTIICFVYSFQKAAPYSNTKTSVAIPYYDYVVLMGCLLLISDLGYIQFQYNLFYENLEWITLTSAIVFFLLAYRFDHLGVLSLGITALASFFGITISPQKWYSADFFGQANLHNIGLVFGAALTGAALALERKKIKEHFTFTYVNFSAVIFLMSALAGIFMNTDSYAGYLLLLYVGCALALYFANNRKSFLFLLYAFVFGYIGTTFFLIDTILNESAILFYYFIASCGGFIYFIIRYKDHFKRKA
jgi:hypothetical protein